MRFRINRTYWSRQTDFSNIQIKYVPRGFGLTKPNSGICYGDDWPQFRGPNRDGKSAETGLLKKCPEVPYQVSSDTSIITPVYKNGYIYVTSVVEREFKRGGVMLELSADGTSVTKKWNNQTLDCGHGGVVLVDGYLYGFSFKGIPKGDWVCLDWDSGKVMYEATWNGNKGSIIYADGMLYCYDENTGDVALVKPSPKAFEIVSSFGVTEGTGQNWAHPAVSDGQLYIRHGDALMTYGIKNK